MEAMPISAIPEQLIPITPLNARQYQTRSVQARISNKLAREQAKLAQEQANRNQVQDTPALRLERQMDLIQARIEKEGKTLKPKELSDLSAALSRLFDLWQVRTGTPNPGSRKSNPRRSTGLSEVQPIQAEPLPSPVETPQAHPRDSYWNEY